MSLLATQLKGCSPCVKTIVCLPSSPTRPNTFKPFNTQRTASVIPHSLMIDICVQVDNPKTGCTDYTDLACKLGLGEACIISAIVKEAKDRSPTSRLLALWENSIINNEKTALRLSHLESLKEVFEELGQLDITCKLTQLMQELKLHSSMTLKPNQPLPVHPYPAPVITGNYFFGTHGLIPELLHTHPSSVDQYLLGNDYNLDENPSLLLHSRQEASDNQTHASSATRQSQLRVREPSENELTDDHLDIDKSHSKQPQEHSYYTQEGINVDKCHTCEAALSNQQDAFARNMERKSSLDNTKGSQHDVQWDHDSPRNEGQHQNTTKHDHDRHIYQHKNGECANNDITKNAPEDHDKIDMCSSAAQLISEEYSVCEIGGAINNTNTEIGGTINNTNTEIGGTINNTNTEIGGAINNTNTEIGGTINNTNTEMGGTTNNTNTEIGGAINNTNTEIGGAINNTNTEIGGTTNNTNTEIGGTTNNTNTEIGGTTNNTNTEIGDAINNTNTEIGGATNNTNTEIGGTISNTNTIRHIYQGDDNIDMCSNAAQLKSEEYSVCEIGGAINNTNTEIATNNANSAMRQKTDANVVDDDRNIVTKSNTCICNGVHTQVEHITTKPLQTNGRSNNVDSPLFML